MTDVPVLLIIYRRPDATARVMEALAAAAPRRLFVAADGPATPAEAESCRRSREIATAVSWDCDVLTDFPDRNLGCRARVITALHWFFDHVEAGIVLEDDCIPVPDFFRFCTELLARYATDERVMQISGETYSEHPTPWSYGFSKYPLTWGWATWRRAWRLFDPDLRLWPPLRAAGAVESLFDTPDERMYWTGVFDQMHAGRIPTAWDYAWWFACITNGLSIRPAVNLVSNVGAGASATHTGNHHDVLFRPTGPLAWPLQHPPCVVRDKAGDLATFDSRFVGAVLKRQRTLRHHAKRPWRWLRRQIVRGRG